MSCKLLIPAALLLSLAGCCNEEKIPAMSAALYSSEARARTDAALGLARCGADAERAVPRLISLMYDSNVGVQSAAAYALRKIDTPAARAAIERVEAKRRKN